MFTSGRVWKFRKSAKRINLIASGITEAALPEKRVILEKDESSRACSSLSGTTRLVLRVIGMLPTLLNSWLSATKSDFSNTL